MKIIPYGRQWIDNKDIKEVVKVLKGDWLTQGSKVEEFEKAVAKYCGAKYAVAVSSGTAALHLAYIVAGIKPGDEIITTPLTFSATANMAVIMGAKPVLVDIDEETLNIDPKLIERAITGKTKAIVPVDFSGQSCDYDEIKEIADKHKLLIIEDAAHALGSLYKGKRIGGFADMTILSFHPVKTITTGEGGMVLTNNAQFFEKLKKLRHHGITKNPEKGKWYYEVENPGYNYRITDFQCALGISQFKKLDKFIKLRRKIAEKYNKAFQDLNGIKILEERGYSKSAWHIYPVQITKADRRKVFEELQKAGIGVQVHYMPLHMHPFYEKKFGYKKGDFLNAEKYYEGAISLPLYPKMSDADINKVIKTVKNILKN